MDFAALLDVRGTKHLCKLSVLTLDLNKLRTKLNKKKNLIYGQQYLGDLQSLKIPALLLATIESEHSEPEHNIYLFQVNNLILIHVGSIFPLLLAKNVCRVYSEAV